MYSTIDLLDKLSDYMIACQCRPTKCGLANALHVNTSTIYRAISGTYNGHIYGQVPHPNRCIDTKDFKIVRDIFT